MGGNEPQQAIMRTLIKIVQTNTEANKSPSITA
jgi:hypothetical protein